MRLGICKIHPGAHSLEDSCEEPIPLPQDNLRSSTWDEYVKIGLQMYLHDMVAKKIISVEHIAVTPHRYVQALAELFKGVHDKPIDALATLFPLDEPSEMIHVKEITFFSMCAHHLVPFFGKMSFAYIPNDKIVGLSKIPRLIEVFARRPQVQESLTSQIVDAFQEIVKPQGCGLMVRAYHMCCMARGIKQPTSFTETTALRGNFKDTTTKAEFISAANANNWRVF